MTKIQFWKQFTTELQDKVANGFKPLNDAVLKMRFDTRRSMPKSGFKIEFEDCLIDIDLLKNNAGFRKFAWLHQHWTFDTNERSGRHAEMIIRNATRRSRAKTGFLRRISSSVPLSDCMDNPRRDYISFSYRMRNMGNRVRLRCLSTIPYPVRGACRNLRDSHETLIYPVP